MRKFFIGLTAIFALSGVSYAQVVGGVPTIPQGVHILIWTAYAGATMGGVATGSQEFTTKERCEQAKKDVEKQRSFQNWVFHSASCSPK